MKALCPSGDRQERQNFKGVHFIYIKYLLLKKERVGVDLHLGVKGN